LVSPWAKPKDASIKNIAINLAVVFMSPKSPLVSSFLF
jgi:hypothetical protein